MRPALALAVLALAAQATPAFGAEIRLWRTFRFPDDGGDLARTNGWVNGYANDTWRGSFQPSGEYAVPKTDDNSDEGFGSGGPADNWIIRGEVFDDARVTVFVATNDDDAVGLVSHHDGDDTFYVLFHTANSAPEPVGGVRDDSLILIRVENGDAEVLARVDAGSIASQDLSRPNIVPIALTFDDGRLVGTLRGNVLIDVTDPSPLPPGKGGFYAYDAGPSSDGFRQVVTFFDEIVVDQIDQDEDGVVDDADNCEDTPNADQANADGDELGDACDETVDDTDEPSETDTDEPSETDTDEPSETDTDASDTDPASTDDEQLTVACEGCAAGGAPAIGGLVLVGALALRRRRR